MPRPPGLHPEVRGHFNRDLLFRDDFRSLYGEPDRVRSNSTYTVNGL
jgi:hypothetical protein